MTWYKKYLSVYNKPYDNTDTELTESVKNNIAAMQSAESLVSVVVIGYNEEQHLLANLWSFSDMKCKYPVEIIGVDNDSKDKTAQIFQDLNIPYYTEYQHSCGYARRCGLEHAKGKYYICIDSDTLYPEKYVEMMVNVLEKPSVVAVSSLWSYIPDKDHSWIGLKFYEFFRDVFLFLQSFKRPELSVRGLVFAYNIELARKVGIRTDIIRGEDGSLALGLKKYGKILFLRNRKARAITGYDTMKSDGSFFNSFKIRVKLRLINFKDLLTSQTEYKDKRSNIIKNEDKDSIR